MCENSIPKERVKLLDEKISDEKEYKALIIAHSGPAFLFFIAQSIISLKKICSKVDRFRKFPLTQFVNKGFWGEIKKERTLENLKSYDLIYILGIPLDNGKFLSSKEKNPKAKERIEKTAQKKSAEELKDMVRALTRFEITGETLEKLSSEIDIDGLKLPIGKKFSSEELTKKLNELSFGKEEIELIFKHARPLKDKTIIYLSRPDSTNEKILEEISRKYPNFIVRKVLRQSHCAVGEKLDEELMKYGSLYLHDETEEAEQCPDEIEKLAMIGKAVKNTPSLAGKLIDDLINGERDLDSLIAKNGIKETLSLPSKVVVFCDENKESSSKGAFYEINYKALEKIREEVSLSSDKLEHLNSLKNKNFEKKLFEEKLKDLKFNEDEIKEICKNTSYTPVLIFIFNRDYNIAFEELSKCLNNHKVPYGISLNKKDGKDKKDSEFTITIIKNTRIEFKKYLSVDSIIREKTSIDEDDFYYKNQNAYRSKGINDKKKVFRYLEDLFRAMTGDNWKDAFINFLKIKWPLFGEITDKTIKKLNEKMDYEELRKKIENKKLIPLMNKELSREDLTEELKKQDFDEEERELILKNAEWKEKNDEKTLKELALTYDMKWPDKESRSEKEYEIILNKGEDFKVQRIFKNWAEICVKDSGNSQDNPALLALSILLGDTEKKIIDRTGKWENVGTYSYEKILEKLFPECDKLTLVKMPAEGLSGNVTVFVRPSNKNRDYNLKLVKLGSRFEMESEKGNYDTVINEYLDTYIGMITKQVVAGEYAGIVYTSVGSSANYLPDKEIYPITFYEYITEKLYKDNGGSYIEKALDIMYHKILKSLYKDKKKKKILPCDKYAIGLPVLLSLEECNAGHRDNILEIDLKASPKKILEECFNGKSKIVKVRNGLIYEVKKKEKNIQLRLYREGKFKIDIEYNSHNVELEKLQKDDEFIDFVGKVIKKDLLDFLIEDRFSFIENLNLPKLPKDIKKLLNLEYDVLDKDTFLKLFDKALIPDYREDGEDCKKWGINCSTIHGDLNLTNILMSGTEKDVVDMPVKTIDYWLVDFAKTVQEGHTAFDFIAIEIGIKNRILSLVFHDIANNLEWLGYNRTDVYRLIARAYKLLEGFMSFRKSFPDESEKEKLYNNILSLIEEDKHIIRTILGEQRIKYIFFIINKLRSIALKEVELTEEEYLYSIIFYHITTIKFEDLAKPKNIKSAPIPILIAYISACVNYEKLVKLQKFRKKEETANK